LIDGFVTCTDAFILFEMSPGISLNKLYIFFL
jgi:hypothetical protein